MAEIQSENNIAYYAVSGTVNVTYAALANRFLPTEEDEAAEEPTEQATEGEG